MKAHAETTCACPVCRRGILPRCFGAGSPLGYRHEAARCRFYGELFSIVALLFVLPSPVCAAPAAAPIVKPLPPPSSIHVSWSTTTIANAQAVYPHPLLPGRALLVADKGLLLTGDAGRTWTPLNQATTARIGKVTGAAFAPDQPDTFYLASDRGLWFANNAGKAIEQTADRRRGLKSDKLAGVAYYEGDPAFRTLLVWYGEETTGASVSYDSGRSWLALWPDLFVHRFVNSPNQGLTFVVLAAQKARPQVINALDCMGLGESLEDNVGDILPTDAAVSLAGHGSRSNRGYHCDTEVFISTSDGDIHDLKFGPDFTSKTGPQGISGWASLGVTCSPVPDTQLFYAYEPEKLGLVLSFDGFKTTASQKAGLPIGPLIKEGSRVRASASGSHFYAVVNNRLYLGVVAANGIAISDPVVAPNIVKISADAPARVVEIINALPHERSAAAASRRLMAAFKNSGQVRMTISAKVAVAGGKKPTSVMVNLWPVGGREQMPMREDPARPGLYTATFYPDIVPLHPNPTRPPPGRFHGPGIVGLVVTATTDDGHTAGVPAPVAVRELVEDLTIWDELPKVWGKEAGKHTIRGAAQAAIVDNPDTAHSGRCALRIATSGGPWSLRLLSAEGVSNLCSYDALSFWVRREGSAGGDLNVQLEDSPLLLEPAATARVPIEAGKYVRGGDLSTEYRQVMIPVSRFLKDAGRFRPTLCRSVIFSGDGRTPATYWIDSVQLLRLDQSDDVATDNNSRY